MVMDPDLVDLIPEYLERRCSEVQTLKNMLGAMDYKGIRTIGHQIKGHAQSYGFPELGTLGAELEAAAESENVPGCEAAIKKIESWTRAQTQKNT